jgi:uncharacterized membrane protein
MNITKFHRPSSTMEFLTTTNRQRSLLLVFLVALVGSSEAFLPGSRGVNRHQQALRRHDVVPTPGTDTRPDAISSSTQLSLSLTAARAATKTLLTPRLLCSEILPVVIGCGAMIYYHTDLQRRELKNDEVTWRTAQADTRVAWSQHVRDTEGWLYAVQTLRNAITANTFLATTVLSLLTVITGKLWSTIAAATTMTAAAGSSSSAATMFSQHYYPRLQFATVALSMLRSAYEFLQSARLMTHAGFMFPVFAKSAENGTNKVDSILRKSSMAQWLGLRWLYIGGTMMVWTMAGEVPFLVTSLVMVRFFRTIDQAPQ